MHNASGTPREKGTPNANASTLGTPPDFNIDVAVLNIGMPTAEHYSAQPGRRLEASGGTRHTKNKNK